MEYEHELGYKELTKAYHDRKIKLPKELKVGDWVLLYNACLRLFPVKLKSRQSSLFEVKEVRNGGSIEINHPEKGKFLVYVHLLKLYYGEIFERKLETLELIEVV